MGSKGRGAGASRSPRKARKGGTDVGGLSAGLLQRNIDAQMYALQAALEFRYVLEDGEDKTLAALAEDLFTAGCRTKGGKPITPKMVERMRNRLVKAKEILAQEPDFHTWSPLYECWKASRQKNQFALRWILGMARKERGASFVDDLERMLLNSEHGAWVEAAMKDSL